MKLATRCVRVRDERDPYGATAPPIYQTATFQQPSALELGEYDYSRTANPTRALAERQIGALEGGAFAFAFASGMAALSALLRLLAAGDEVLAGEDLYGGSARLLSRVAPRLGLRARHVDATDAGAVERALGERTRLLLVESPSNPLQRVADLPALAALCRRRGLRLAVDNSLCSPILQRPLELGADLVVHSATKLLCGHADVLAGAVVCDDAALAETLGFHQNAEGAGLAPFDAWLLVRGMKTLALRVERQSASAAKIAAWLREQPGVERVYGGEPRGGPLVSFTTGDEERSRRLVESLRLFAIAVSFGAVGSTVSLPCRMSHASIPPELAERLMPPRDLVRLSVGIEDCGDLLADLAAALAAVRAGTSAAARTR